MPVSRSTGNGFGVSLPNCRLQLSEVVRPGSEATPALKADSNVIGELGR